MLTSAVWFKICFELSWSLEKRPVVFVTGLPLGSFLLLITFLFPLPQLLRWPVTLKLCFLLLARARLVYPVF